MEHHSGHHQESSHQSSDSHSDHSMHHAKSKSSEMEHRGHHDHHAMMIQDFKKRFYVVLILTVPILLLSEMIQQWLGLSFHFKGDRYILLALSSFVFFYGGWPFLKGWYTEMRKWKPGMMTLIGFAITVAFFYSVATVLGLEGKDFFWELCTLILIMLLGHWIEMKSVARASGELNALVRLMPDTAHLLRDGQTEEVKSSELRTDHLILIKPGEKIAADGLIQKGESYVDESMLTGESKPVKKSRDQKVIAGSINGNGSLEVKVLHPSTDSYLSQVIHLVEGAQKNKSRTQLLADKAAAWLTGIAILAGLITFFAWYLSGRDLAFSIERMVTVIVICCPHALGLAVPLVVAKSTALSAKNGLLIKNRTDFENTRKITSLVFDKTGTLTMGKFEVSGIDSLKEGYDQNEIIKLAAALEQQSEHPIATGILQKSREDKLEIPKPEDFKAITGKGIQGMVNGKLIRVVSPGYLREAGIPLTEGFKQEAGKTVVFVLEENEPVGSISLSDQVRPESSEAIRTLKQNHIEPVIMTGDNQAVAEAVGTSLGIEKVYAGLLPHEKLEKIKELQLKKEFVGMTGDGINDAPALAQADVGIAVGSGSDVAAETAGIILVNSNPADIVKLILFGKATYRKMIQNLGWATGYNLVAMPLAAGVLYPFGILLSPAIGAVLMSLSTVVVAINASFLKI